MKPTVEKYYPTVLFILNSNETKIDSIEVNNLDTNEIYGVLINLDNNKFVNLTKTRVFITDQGKLYLKQKLFELELDFIEFMRKKETDISEKVNSTDFMVSNFIKPD